MKLTRPKQIAARILASMRRMHSLKYIVVIVVAVVLVGFLDENSVWSHFTNKQRIAGLKAEIKQYLDSYHRDIDQLHQLDRDPKAIEKIARERYFMKTDDEDIFVLSDDVADDGQQSNTETDGTNKQ